MGQEDRRQESRVQEGRSQSGRYKIVPTWNVERGTWNALTESQRSARIADTYSSRRGGRADLTRRATETDAGVLMQYAEEVEGSATPSGWTISAHAVE